MYRCGMPTPCPNRAIRERERGPVDTGYLGHRHTTREVLQSSRCFLAAPSFEQGGCEAGFSGTAGRLIHSFRTFGVQV